MGAFVSVSQCLVSWVCMYANKICQGFPHISITFPFPEPWETDQQQNLLLPKGWLYEQQLLALTDNPKHIVNQQPFKESYSGKGRDNKLNEIKYLQLRPQHWGDKEKRTFEYVWGLLIILHYPNFFTVGYES